jgi:hypothetical protein
MTDPHDQQPSEHPPRAIDAGQPEAVPLGTPLPRVRTGHDAEEIVATLRTLAKRGKLPGFVSPGRGGGLFTVDAFGTPFDKYMTAEASEREGVTELSWRLDLKRKMPAILLVMLIVSVWPGLPLTDSLMKTYFAFYRDWTSGWFSTWMWYLPMTVPTVPLTWHIAMKRTRISTHQHAHETAAKIAAALDGQTVG